MQQYHVTNWYGKAVRALSGKIPPEISAEISAENSTKQPDVQQASGAFNIAPADGPSFQSAGFAHRLEAGPAQAARSPTDVNEQAQDMPLLRH
jgi:hypothetical protein